eukprot:scaffold124871_cov25-Tisochrysis_lutea.AAC.2
MDRSSALPTEHGLVRTLQVDIGQRPEGARCASGSGAHVARGRGGVRWRCPANTRASLYTRDDNDVSEEEGCSPCVGAH